MSPDRVVRSRRVVLSGGVRPAAIHVSKGRIAAVSAWEDVPAGCPLDDADSLVVLPGLVDTHVHVNEPGRADWEGFETATRAAAAGGVTTIADMPLNSIPPTTTVRGLEAKAAAAEGKCHVDVGFVGGVVPSNGADLRALGAAGVVAFKCFLAPSGVPEFDPVDAEALRAALGELGEAPLLVHAELPDRLRDAPAGEDGRRYAAWLETRPPEAEDRAVDLLVGLSRDRGARIHVVHLSSAGALAAIRRAKDAGAGVTVETCPHYLSVSSEEIPDGATLFKCAPPIRGRENRARLWDALEGGLVDQIVSDHSPAPPAAKAGDFLAAWGGIASLELGLSLVWTEAATRGIGVERIAEWMCAAPARLVGLAARKGSIAPGLDADLCVWDPDARRTVDPGALHQRHAQTPYAGRELRGVVQRTYLAGEPVFEGGRFSPPRGRLLRP